MQELYKLFVVGVPKLLALQPPHENHLLMQVIRAGDGIRTHGMVPWEGTALPLGDTRTVIGIICRRFENVKLTNW